MIPVPAPPSHPKIEPPSSTAVAAPAAPIRKGSSLAINKDRKASGARNPSAPRKPATPMDVKSARVSVSRLSANRASKAVVDATPIVSQVALTPPAPQSLTFEPAPQASLVIVSPTQSSPQQVDVTPKPSQMHQTVASPPQFSNVHLPTQFSALSQDAFDYAQERSDDEIFDDDDEGNEDFDDADDDGENYEGDDIVAAVGYRSINDSAKPTLNTLPRLSSAQQTTVKAPFKVNIDSTPVLPAVSQSTKVASKPPKKMPKPSRPPLHVKV